MQQQTSDQPPGVAAILLAAGESTRMGQQKALLPWRGTPLIRHQINALLEAGVSQVIAVLGHRAETLRPLVEPFPRAKAVLNLRYRTGRSSSVRVGLRHVDPRAKDILVLAVDQPRSSEVVGKVIAAHRHSGSAITYPAYHGKGGHPIIFSRALLPELVRIRESRLGLREVLERHRLEALRIEVDDAEVLLDLNLPGDYRRAVGERDQGT